MYFDPALIIQKIAFIIVHKATIWSFLICFITAPASWYLAIILTKHNARLKEAKLAKKVALGYAAAGFALWFLSLLLN